MNISPMFEGNIEPAVSRSVKYARTAAIFLATEDTVSWEMESLPVKTMAGIVESTDRDHTGDESPSGKSRSLKISAVTATRNRVDWLPRCIESVANQSFPNREHIIVDGGSTDGTVELLRAASARYPHLRWISEPNKGLSDALNKGISLADGDAIGVIGDDDFYAPNAFRSASAAFEAHPGAGLIAGNCRVIRNDTSTVSLLKAAFTNRRDLIACWETWGKTVCLPAPSTFFRRTVIDKVGGFEERDRYAMDYRHWIKITKYFEVATIDEVLANFRYDEGNLSFSSSAKQWQETISISKEYWGSPVTGTYYGMLLSYATYRAGLIRPKARSLIWKIRHRLHV